jgi:hypothetical protein
MLLRRTFPSNVSMTDRQVAIRSSHHRQGAAAREDTMTTTEAFLVLVRSSKAKGSNVCSVDTSNGGGLLHCVDKKACS